MSTSEEPSTSTDYQKYQQSLLATVIKWTRIFLIVGLGINSLWFLWDFWNTLIQNLGILLVILIYQLCLRMMQRGQQQRAARVFLASGIVLAAGMIPLIGPNFALMGVVGLCLFVMLATLLETPGFRGYWGAAATALHLIALTLLIVAPIYDMHYAASDIIGLYLFPTMGLIAFTFLGRGLAGNLREALTASEASRRELERSNQTLHEAQADLRVAYERLQELDRVKDTFISNVSHELRTPIANLRLYHYLLTENPDKQAHYLSTLQRETERLEYIVEDLLYLSRMDREHKELMLEPLDLNVLTGVFLADHAALAESKGLILTLEQAPGPLTIQGNRGMLERVLSVLVTNALSYTPEGGRVTVRTHARQMDGAHWAGFSVSDDGPGISPDEMSHLFERFFRGKAARKANVPGTGLGLAIVKEIVERHKGRVDALSEGEPGKGVTFTVWLQADEE
jgi:signal transduction histidine kinase